MKNEMQNKYEIGDWIIIDGGECADVVGIIVKKVNDTFLILGIDNVYYEPPIDWFRHLAPDDCRLLDAWEQIDKVYHHDFWGNFVKIIRQSPHIFETRYYVGDVDIEKACLTVHDVTERDVRYFLRDINKNVMGKLKEYLFKNRTPTTVL